MEFANTFGAMMNYLSTDGKPVDLPEFRIFWLSLDEVEKDYYRWLDLKTGLPSRY